MIGYSSAYRSINYTNGVILLGTSEDRNCSVTRHMNNFGEEQKLYFAPAHFQGFVMHIHSSARSHGIGTKYRVRPPVA
jgi:hypothetical protein